MEGVAPPLELLIVVKSSLECGESVRTGIRNYLRSSSHEFTSVVRQWMFLLDQNMTTQALLDDVPSPYRRALFRVLQQGLQGQSILPTLKELEIEIKEASQREIDRFISLLPIKMLVPLLLFQFPAYLILLLCPLVRKFMDAL